MTELARIHSEAGGRLNVLPGMNIQSGFLSLHFPVANYFWRQNHQS